jgi:histidinol-phosphate aminotransferase
MDFFPTVKENLPGVRNYQPGKPIEELQREAGIRNATKMASNENALGPSPKAISAIRKNLSVIHRYPDGGCYYLRQKLSKRLSVTPDALIFGNGSDELLVFVSRAFVRPGSEVVIADPTFLIYAITVQVENGVAVKVPMRDFRYDLNGMLDKINDQTRVVFIANPDNPVGTYISEKALVGFLKSVPSGVVVVLDEAYCEFAQTKKDYPDSIKLLRSFKNLFVTRTFSKAYGLSGLRVGYGIGHPSLIGCLNKVREPFNVNLLAQAGALAALDDHAHLAKTVRLVNDGRKYLERELRQMNFKVIDTVTNFILFDMGIDSAPIYEKLLRKGIIVRSMSGWGLRTFIRVTIGKKSENERFIKCLKEIKKEFIL